MKIRRANEGGPGLAARFEVVTKAGKDAPVEPWRGLDYEDILETQYRRRGGR
jgi:hypothetical protein